MVTRREVDFNRLACIITDIKIEYGRACSLHPKFNSRHEGYAILQEEVDELWDEVKTNHLKTPKSKVKMKKEAIQVAAMAIRFIEDCCVDCNNEPW